MRLLEITKYLEKKFPFSDSEDWDNVGFQTIDNKLSIVDAKIDSIMTCLDLDYKALDFAVESNVKLIITRHPFIFNDLSKELENPAKKKMIKILKENNILVYSIHTNFDCSIFNNLTLKIENIFNVKKITRNKKNTFFNEIELKENISLINILDLLKLNTFGDQIRIRVSANFDPNKIIKNFKISQGSAGVVMLERRLENDVLITGEVKWNEWVYACDNNMTLIEIGHYFENNFNESLKTILENKFNISVFSFNIKNKFKEV